MGMESVKERFWFSGLEFRVQGLGFRVQGLGFRVLLSFLIKVH